MAVLLSVALVAVAVAGTSAVFWVKNKRQRAVELAQADQPKPASNNFERQRESNVVPVPKLDPAPKATNTPSAPKDTDLRPVPPAPENFPFPNLDRPGPIPTEDTPPVKPRQPFVKAPRIESIPGYYGVVSDGFSLYVSRLAYEKSDEAEGGPLQLVYDELSRVAELFPPDTVKALRGFDLWVEWDHTIPRSARAFAVYYGTTGEGLLSEGVDPRKADCVCILSLKTAVVLKKAGGRQNTLLHEFAHIVHAKVYPDNTFIRNAYEQARARHLYDQVKHDNGRVGPGYASRNEYEYFAELTCAYFDRLDYPPHDRKELKDLDSVGYTYNAGGFRKWLSRKHL